MAIKLAAQYNKDYTDPELRERLKEKIKSKSKGGRVGQWSARKSQLLKQAYEKHGGGYKHLNHTTHAQQSLHKWSQEEWQTVDHTVAVQGNKTKRYLPKKVWDQLTPAERKTATVLKEQTNPHDHQYVANSKSVQKKIKRLKHATSD